MKFFRKLMILPLMAIMITGCETTAPNKAQSGTVLGGLIGGALASNVGGGTGKTAAIIGGTLLGAYFGNSVGESLDRADRMYMQKSQNQAYSAPIGQKINWNNPESGHGGSIIPTRDGTATSGEYCREFQQTIQIGGKTEQAYGTACKQPNGSWRILN